MSRQLHSRTLRRPRATTAQVHPAASAGKRAKATEDYIGLWSWVLRYSAVLAALILATALLIPIREVAGLLNMGLVYLILVIGATVFGGREVGIWASLLGFTLFNFFLVPPYYSLVVSELQNILALFVFLGVSLLISWLISGTREQARQAERRAGDVSRLYELSRTIIGANSLDDVLAAIANKVADVFEAGACWILLPNEHQQLEVVAQVTGDVRAMTRDEMSLAMLAFGQGRETGQGAARNRWGSRTVQASFVPLHGASRIIGVLAVADKADDHPFVEAERTVLATFADQAAVAIERLTLLREAARAEVLARTDELKSALMSAVSHDLRTPLASIVASVTSLLEPDIEWDEETKRDFLQGIYDEAQRLNRLVSNLLDMSRIEGGALHPQKDWYEIREVIEAVIKRLDARLEKHVLTLDIADDMPLVLFDFTQIDQVLSNLLENAIKYTPPDSRVVVRARRFGEKLQIEVEDNGPGVQRQDLSRLFDKFYQGPRNRRQQGAGLGLAVSKGLVEAHSGNIWAENRPGGGLKVTFTLPLQPVSTPQVHHALAGRGEG